MSVWLYDGDSLDENWNKLKEAIDFMQNKTNAEINKLKSQLEIKPIQKFEHLFLEGVKVSTWEDSSWYSKRKYIRINYSEECNKFLKTQNIHSEGTWSGYRFFSISEDGLKSAYEFIDALAEFDKEKHQNNIVKCKSNNETYAALMNLLERIGISSTYYGYKSNRSRKKDWIRYNWQSEISGQIPRTYSSSYLSDLVKKHKDSIQKIYDTEMKKIEEEKRKAEEEKKLKEQNRKLALLLAKYDLDLDCDWNDLLDEVINKNKYLRLAYYLEKNRNDWNDGCSYAEIGLRNFNIENELDQKIYDDIIHYIYNWGDYMDGRCFRDCKYNYSELYGIVAEQDPDLYKDFQVIIENISDY